MYTAMYTDVKKPDKTLAQDYQLFSFSFSCFGLRFCDLTKRVSLRWLISKGWRLATGWLAGWLAAGRFAGAQSRVTPLLFFYRPPHSPANVSSATFLASSISACLVLKIQLQQRQNTSEKRLDR